jgi:hypothetical protein
MRRVGTRETRERWPLPTEVNRDSKSTNERSPILGWFVGLVVSVHEIFFCLGCSSQPSTNIFSSPYIFSISLSPPPSKLGWQPCWVYLSLGMCLWLGLPPSGPSPNTLRGCTHCTQCTSSILAVLE